MLKEHPQFPKFYQIPEFSCYVMSLQGEVINTKTGTTLAGSTNPAGYHNFRLMKDDGTIRTVGRHRLLCIVFLPTEKNYDKLFVNHINGIKGDDRVENLEWVTPSENQEHAGKLGLTPKCIPVEVRNVDSGKIYQFPSVRKCAEFFRMTKDEILHRIKHDESFVYPERRQYRKMCDNSPWPIPENIDKSILLYGTSKCVVTRCAWTGQETVYMKLTDLAIALKVSPSTLTKWMNTPGELVYPGFIQLKWGYDTSPWREIGDPYLELNQSTGHRAVMVYNQDSDDLQIFLSGKMCATCMNIPTSVVHYRVQTNGSVVFSDGYRYGYYPFECPSPMSTNGPTE